MSVYDDLFFTENIASVNKIVEKIIFCTCMLPVFFFVFTVAGIWIVPHMFSGILFGFCILTSVLVYFLNRNPNTQKISMIVSLLFCMLCVCMLGTSGIINISVVFGIVPFISCLYYNKRLTLVMTLINLFALIIVYYIRSFTIFDNYRYSLENFSRQTWFISSVIGFSIEFIFVILVAVAISTRAKESIRGMADLTCERDKVNAELLEEQEKLSAANEKLIQTQNKIIKFIAEVLGSHDLFTGRHVVHTQKYVGIIARQLRENGQYTDILTDEQIRLYKTAAFLHDIGKIHIPEGVLNKPGRLTEQEFDLMKTHPTEGNKLLDLLPPIQDGKMNEVAKEMAFCHHEKWDGSGYPSGLKGTEIPLSARIMAAADVLDALVSQRLYKSPMTFDVALKIFEEERGTHFEPAVVDAILACRSQLEAEDARFKEQEEEDNKRELEWWKSYHEKLRQISV